MVIQYSLEHTRCYASRAVLAWNILALFIRVQRIVDSLCTKRAQRVTYDNKCVKANTKLSVRPVQNTPSFRLAPYLGIAKVDAKEEHPDKP